jgi:hypothetical protein
MIPNPPMPDDDPTSTPDVPDLGREDDMERTLDDRDGDRAVPEEEQRPETTDQERGVAPVDRPRIDPDDATPTEGPGLSPI